MMNRLLIISQHFPPEIGAASNRMEQLTSRLARRGYTLYVVTAKPSYPEPALYRNVSFKAEQERLRQTGIHLYRTPSVSRLFSGKASRAANQLLFLVSALFLSLFICLKHSVRICLTTSPPFPVNLIGWFLARVLKVRWVMEVRDLWPDSLAAVAGWKESSFLFGLLKRLEHQFYRTAHRVVVVTDRFRDKLIQAGVPAKRIAVITNGIPDWVERYRQEREPSVEQEKPERHTPGQPDGGPRGVQEGRGKGNGQPQEFRAVYIGNLGMAQGLEQILQVARQMKEEQEGQGPVQFYFVGEGLAKTELARLAKEWGLSNVHFIPGQTDKKELAKWYREADVGLVSLKPDPLFTTVIPSKVFEYAAWGLPILFIGAGEGAEVVEKYGLGRSVDYDTIAIKEGLLALLKEKRAPDPRDAEHQKHVEQFRNRFSWDTLINDYIDLLSGSLYDAAQDDIPIRER